MPDKTNVTFKYMWYNKVNNEYCSKAQSKYEKGSSQFNRFEPIIQAMLISKAFIEDQINIDSTL